MRVAYNLQRGELKPDITPLIDVVLLLIIFFMLASNFVYSTSITVKLPKAQTATIANKQGVTITVDADSSIYLDDKEISMQDVHKIFRSLSDDSIAIVADKEAPMGTVIAIWDSARKHKLDTINIMARN